MILWDTTWNNIFLNKTNKQRKLFLRKFSNSSTLY